MEQIKKSEKEWKEILSKEQYNILRKKGTETPCSSHFLYNKEKGTYHCAGCGNLIFNSKDKFDSGTGWPSFKDIAVKNSVVLKKNSDGIRTEVSCEKCRGHLGHVFEDGPKPTGKRYCMNGIVLKFKEDFENSEKAVFGAGCFWHIQEEFDKLKGASTEVGYMGGDEKKFPNPDYKTVGSDKAGYTEVVQITFNPDKLEYEKLLKIFWKIHNPASLNRQGNDVGVQYKSVIFYTNQNQKILAEKSKQEMQKKYGGKIVTEIIKSKTFFPAEEYHQKYYLKSREMLCRV